MTFLDAIFQLPYMEREFMRASPDGRWIAWSWYGIGPCADVYAAPTDASAPPLRLSDTRENTLLVAWTPDSRAVLVHQDHDGDERFQLFRIELARPCELIPLTEAQPNYFLRGGELHPNGRWLVYGANYDFDARRETEATWVWRHDLETGERRALARPTRTRWSAPQLSPTGTQVLYERVGANPSHRSMWLADVEGNTDRAVLDENAFPRSSASWFPDGKRLVVLGETDTHRKLGVYDIERGIARWLIDDAARNIEKAFAPFGSECIVVIELYDAHMTSSLLDPATGAECRMPKTRGDLMPLAPVRETDWVGMYAHSQQPDDFVRFRLDAVDASRFVSLTRVWEKTTLTRADFVAAQDFHWQSVDGLEIQGWLYHAEKPRGTIVYVHGGPTWHHEDRINPEIQFYVRAGFNVLDPNYRGSTGFSIAYREAIKREGWGGLEQEDIRTGIAALQRAGIAEKFRVGITGTSYGGYSAWWAITHFSTEIVAAAAPVCGMTDLVIDYETTRPDLRPLSEEMMGGSPMQIPEKYRARSPIHFVQNLRGKLLIVQGMQDPNVTPENVRVVTERLQDAGIEYRLLVFEDEGHGIYKPKNLMRLCEEIAEFFGRAFGE
ncbi:MAG: S9 family peptidase [Chloroflexi bacterium]|nr:S9 family peptidase [Chloroflexota bacterium]